MNDVKNSIFGKIKVYRQFDKYVDNMIFLA